MRRKKNTGNRRHYAMVRQTETSAMTFRRDSFPTYSNPQDDMEVSSWQERIPDRPRTDQQQVEILIVQVRRHADTGSHHTLLVASLLLNGQGPYWGRRKNTTSALPDLKIPSQALSSRTWPFI
ncbi:hypothetical protein CHS0354_003736 [Potamilus streckersoni]|uniref:Uncharacterized protein n=1 Tax=Potamilus streckersoni TaxID=2493646 RepID=A0AAE0SNI3_9BIVA|nr:hypothetical protein CHS0354_003736 [Potamilus streckersoni]